MPGLTKQERLDRKALLAEGKKRCRACGEILPIDSFYRNVGASNDPEHRTSQCKKCLEASRIERKYGLPRRDYWALLEAQDGKCAICSKAINVTEERRAHVAVALCVDHDHSTGQVRGLLCFACNRGIGQFRDDHELLRLAAHYLERQRTDVYLIEGAHYA